MNNVCPLCGGELLSRGLDTDFGLTRCQGCNARFELSSLARVDNAVERVAPVRREDVPMPFWAKTSKAPGSLQLRIRFFGPTFMFAILFAAIWDFVMVMFLTGDSSELQPFLLVHMAVGVGATYIALAGVLNSRRVILTRGRLSVRVGPLPWPGRLDIHTADLTQLFCKTVVSETDYGKSYTYEVHALMNGHRRQCIIKGLSTLPQALWLEQEIERFLDIRDEPVRGESTRPS